MPEASDAAELPPKEPALFVIGVLVQAWFLLQKPKRRVEFVAVLRGLIGRYRSGDGPRWRPGMSKAEVRETSRAACNWLAGLADLLDSLSR